MRVSFFIASKFVNVSSPATSESNVEFQAGVGHPALILLMAAMEFMKPG